jgi:hypothetical protein
LLAAVGVFAFPGVVEARRFQCSGGDVSCLIAAIEAANRNGQENTIVLAAGVYSVTSAGPDVRWGPTGLPPITSKMTIRGDGAETTIIERAADASFRLFTILENLSLERVTLRGGGGQEMINGGAILAIGRLTLSDSVVTGGRARDGGGLEIRGPATIANSTILATSRSKAPACSSSAVTPCWTSWTARLCRTADRSVAASVCDQVDRSRSSAAR